MLSSIWKTMRPNHWLKNVFVLAPMFFSLSFTDTRLLASSALVFVAFSLMSSAAYFFNDVIDRERDKIHPEKCKRPIAAGLINVPTAIGVAIAFCAISLILTYYTTPIGAGILTCYALVNISYSLWFKHVVIADVFCIALGFVLRVIAGAFAISVEITAWIVVATFLLALFLGLAKRRNELLVLEKDSADHRPILNSYTPQLLDELISVVTPITLVTYLLYTLDPETTERLGTEFLYPTGIFVMFGIFRYLYLIHKENLGGSPTDIVVRDRPMLLALIGWIATFALITYFS